MPDCQNHEVEMEAVLCGKTAITDSLLTHIDHCPRCRAMLKAQEWLTSASVGLKEPPDAAFRSMRNSVMHALNNRGRVASLNSGFGSGHGISLWQRAWIPATMAACLILGFAGGLRQSSDTPEHRDFQQAIEGLMMAHQPSDMPFQLDLLQLYPGNDNQVSVEMNVSRTVDMKFRRDDPVLAALIRQSLRQADAVPEKLEIIQAAGSLNQPEVRKALIESVTQDPHVAVRLRAMEALKPLHQDPDVQQACLDVLRRDDAVQMRLLAVDFLAGNDHDKLDQALESLNQPEDMPVLIRAENLKARPATSL